jgi:hypothetical protein
LNVNYLLLRLLIDHLRLCVLKGYASLVHNLLAFIDDLVLRHLHERLLAEPLLRQVHLLLLQFLLKLFLGQVLRLLLLDVELRLRVEVVGLLHQVLHLGLLR